MDPERFELQIPVVPSDIDELGHVNNVVYLRWIQEVSIAHWTSAASPEAQAALYWVVTRHEVDYLRPVLDGDSILARTWVGTARRRSFQRHTELVRTSDGKVVVRGLTFWCPIDAQTGRPTDPGPEVRERFSVPSPNP